ncbi:SUMF1/EgtB/PvdO family nonheme iron enzyme [candidate division KSB1 bacterium]|nr:SUMF1/EgtB/PvdO family nonheme iron enzyme [candidate division KSB1 bacterium]
MTAHQTVNIFLSCPGDVNRDKLALKTFLEEQNSTFREKYDLELKVLIWEEDAPDAYGPGRIQQKINPLIDKSHIYIGLMGKRFGGSTGLFPSGTNEEFAYAYHRWERDNLPHMRFFFKNVSLSMDAPKEEFEQARKIREFKETIKSQFFPGTYKSSRDLCPKVLEQLHVILPKIKDEQKPAEKTIPLNKDVLQVYKNYLGKKYQRIAIFQNVDFELKNIYVSLRLYKDPALWQEVGEAEMRRKTWRSGDAKRLQEVMQESGMEAGAVHTLRPDFTIDNILELTSQGIILGEPGAGKTTLFKHLIAKYHNNSNLYPVLLPVKFWVQCKLCDPLDAFVDSLKNESLLIEPELLPVLRTLLHDRFKANKLLILLDGLDEVGPDAFGQVCESLKLIDFGDNKVLLSCRRASYKPLLSRDKWQVYCINPFNKAERREFMRNYFGKTNPAAEQLSGLVEGRSRLRSLAETPLLLGLICYIYEQDKESLPEERVLLYERCVTELLNRRGDQVFKDFNDFKLQVLRRVAYDFFTSAKNSERERFPGEKLRDLFRAEMKTRPEVMAGIRAERAGQLLQEIVDANGLLLPAGADHYCFPHRSFQEYFAAGFLDKSKTGLGEILERFSGDAFWSETICLYAGLQPNATQLINGLGKKERVDLAIRVIPEAVRVDWDDLDQDTLNWKIRRGAVEKLVLPEPDKGKLDDITDSLKGILHTPDPNANVRYSALVALEKINTPEALGIVKNTWIIPPDRLENAQPFTYTAQGKTFEINKPGMPPNMVHVPGGTFTMGETKKQATVQDFFMSIFPVTCREYKLFIENDGYKNDTYWSKEGFKYKKDNSLSEPMLWSDSRFNHPWQPVLGVSFYEVEAYCRWLTEFFHADPPIRLPTEEEWEHAARGPQGEEWSFGEWNPDIPRWDSFFDYEKGLTFGPARVNTVYKDCVSGFGLFDMSGNVWEWTDSWYSKESRVVRGGSWSSDLNVNLRSAYRYFRSPWSRCYYVGFRCLQDSRLS